jgi:hypothetical protein
MTNIVRKGIVCAVILALVAMTFGTVSMSEYM